MNSQTSPVMGVLKYLNLLGFENICVERFFVLASYMVFPLFLKMLLVLSKGLYISILTQ